MNVLDPVKLKAALSLLQERKYEGSEVEGVTFDEDGISVTVNEFTTEVGPNVHDFPGCCGIQVISSFRITRYFPEEKAAFLLALEDEYSNSPKESSGLVLATTIPSQKGGIDLLEYAGFTPLLTFVGKTKNLITLWALNFGVVPAKKPVAPKKPATPKKAAPKKKTPSRKK